MKLIQKLEKKERLEDAKVRYKNKPLSVWSNEEKANHLIECSLGIEKQIMEYCKCNNGLDRQRNKNQIIQ